MPRVNSQVRQISVIGAGLAGLACALAAAAEGVAVEVFEASAQLPRVEAQVEVVPNMLRGLVALGVGEQCVRAGFPFHQMELVDQRGRTQMQVTIPRLAGARYPAALGIRLEDLQRILLAAARDNGVRVHWGCAVGFVAGAGGSVLLAADGVELPGDVVLAASGAEAALRRQLFPLAPEPTLLAQGWWYLLVKRPLRLNGSRIAIGPGRRKVVMVPVRADLAGLAYIHPEGSVPADTAPAGYLRQALAAFPEMEQGVARQLSDSTPVAIRPVRAGLLPQPWYSGRVLAVGDCAHAIPPHFGQSAAQSVEDALVLRALLATNVGWQELMQSFSERRGARAGAVHALASTAARWDLSPDDATDFLALSKQLTRLSAEPA
jgi:2-polyprenyl-6-methoxyphenol hydroxylase-like FAD-dependent oxidoreductase